MFILNVYVSGLLFFQLLGIKTPQKTVKNHHQHHVKEAMLCVRLI